MSAPGAVHWIASYPKSGNTLIRLMIASLFIGRRATFSELEGNSALSSVRAHAKANPAALKDGRTLMQIVRRGQHAARAGGDVFLKTHAAAIRVGDLDYIDWSATASFIYVIRDPREVALSFANHTGVTLASAIARISDPKTSLKDADGFVEPLSTWSNHVTSWLSAPKSFSRIVFRFEDLIAEKTRALSALNAFYRFGRSADEIGEIAAALSFEALQAEETRDGFREAPSNGRFFRRGETASWKEEDVDAFEPLVAQNGEMMKRFNYL